MNNTPDTHTLQHMELRRCEFRVLKLNLNVHFFSPRLDKQLYCNLSNGSTRFLQEHVTQLTSTQLAAYQAEQHAIVTQGRKKC